MELQYWQEDQTRRVLMEFWGCWESGECLLRVLRVNPQTGVSRTLRLVRNPDAITAYALAEQYDLEPDEWFQAVNSWLSEAPPVLH